MAAGEKPDTFKAFTYDSLVCSTDTEKADVIQQTAGRTVYSELWRKQE